MKKIKVAEVITRLDWGGSTDIIRIICSNLNADLYDITLVVGLTRYPSEKTKKFLRNFSRKIAVIPELKRDINPVSDLAALIRLFFLFREEKFDIVHTHTAKAGILARLAASLSSKSIIIHTPHGHDFYGYFGTALSKIIIIIERLAARFTDKIIVLTELEKKEYIKFHIAGPEKINLIPQGLELERHSKIDIDKVTIKNSLGIQPEESLVGMIGRLEPVKGPQFFVEAAAHIVKQFVKIKFILVGEGSLRKELEKKVIDLGLKDRFIFTGWLEDITDILSILDILVFPSLNEAVGIVLIEAQAMGVPIVATNVGGIPEIVRDNETAVLVHSADPYNLAAAVKNLLKDKQKRLDMSKAARAWVAGKFKAQDMVNKISDLYKEMIQRSEQTK